MNSTAKLETVRGRLAAVWFGGSAIFFLLLVAQSLGGTFGERLDKAWAWAIPNIAPTLSLMLSVFAAYALVPEAEVDKMIVRKNFYLIALWLSVFYLLNLIIVVIAAPFSVASGGGAAQQPVDVMHTANFWLGPLQGLAAAALAAVFFTKGDQG